MAASYNNRLFSECFLMWSGYTVAYGTDITVNGKGDTIEITSAQSPGAKEFLPGLVEWDMDQSGFWVRGILSGGTGTTGVTYLVTVDQLINNWNNGNTYVQVVLTSSVAGDKVWTGNAILTTWSFTAKINDKASYKIALKGTGLLSVSNR
jgi:predicted secreted protein